VLDNTKFDVGPLREVAKKQNERLSSMFKSAPRTYHYKLEMKTDLEKPGFEKYNPNKNVVLNSPFGGGIKIPTGRRNTNLA